MVGFGFHEIPDIDEIAHILQVRLVASWADAIQAITERWRELELRGVLNANTAGQAVREVLGVWPELTAGQYEDIVDRIFTSSFAYGAQDAGYGPDMGDYNALEWIKNNPNGFVPALRNLGDEGRRSIERVIENAYAGVDEVGNERPFDLDDMVDRVERAVGIGANRAELIVRTETAKASALGRIFAWEKDDQRDWYDYWWIATPDDRTKDVSLLFEGQGPYDFNGIKRVWEFDHNHPVWVRNRHTGRNEWQTSAYNCRCTVARTPKEPQDLLNEGKINQREFEAMARA